eukprot:TRINITY_DN10770_c0_g1_i6.p2 TRINITY_DN10770_c0_g1~~TRINITY_DN10770_c0_g1_i6.p2  ORF type:complete len:723 (-),score=157.95 TRINITY_DN10770_c0_g1_i6:2143-4281(-)
MSGELAPPLLALTPTMSRSENDAHLVYLFSCPLVFGNKTNFAMLDIDAERKELEQVFTESNRDFRVRYDWCCAERFQGCITRRCKALHFSGHGFNGSLGFETPYGELQNLKLEDLKALVSVGAKNRAISLVFVSACNSEQAGKAFVDAGVPHVIAVDARYKISDRACHSFSKQFYLSLLAGDTVSDAFQKGRNGVATDPFIFDEKEAAKFLLLPPNGNHDEPIFDDLPEPGRYNMVPISHPPNSNMSAVPEKFQGRRREAQELFERVLKNRFVNVVGDAGIGKTALCRFVFKYIYDRKRFENLIWIDLRHVFESGSYQELCQLFVEELKQSKVIPRDSNVQRLRDFVNEMRDLRSSCIFFIDEVDVITDFEKGGKFCLPTFIEACLNCQHLHFVCISRAEMPIVDNAAGKAFRLGGTNAEDTKAILKNFASENLHLLEDIESDLLQKLKGNPAVIKKFAFDLKIYNSIEEIEEKIDKSVRHYLREADREGSLGKLLRHYNVSRAGWELWREAFSTADQVERKRVFKLVFDHFNSRVKHYGRRVLKIKDQEFMMQIFDEYHNNHEHESISIDEFGSFFAWLEALLATISLFPEVWNLNHESHKVFHFRRRDQPCWIDLVKKKPGTWFLKPSETVPGNITLTLRDRSNEFLLIRLESTGTGWSCIFRNDPYEAGSLVDLIREIPELEYVPSGLSTTRWMAEAFGDEKEGEADEE